jgi:hypothetical protein
MKVFISQPMNGKTDEEIRAVRKKALESVQAKFPGETVEEIKSFFPITPDGIAPGVWCLERSIELMAEADVVYFAKGWETARGCKIENEVALAYDMTVIEDYTKD